MTWRASTASFLKNSRANALQGRAGCKSGRNMQLDPAPASSSLEQLRHDIDRMLSEQQTSAAHASLKEYWARGGSPSTASYVASCFERLSPQLSLKSHRVALIGSFTIHPMIPWLRAGAFTGGIDLKIHSGEFNAYAQEILDAGSRLYTFQPDSAILAVQTIDIAPELWHSFADLSSGDVDRVVERVSTQFHELARVFRSHTQTNLVIHTLEQPAVPANGLLDAHIDCSQTVAIGRINDRLRAIAADIRGVYILDYDALTARHGRATWRDERKWVTVRFPVAAGNIAHLAREWLRFLHPLSGRIAKVLVTDLDNTLWHGVIGEDGLKGIRVDRDYPGAAYLALQRTMLDLRQRGILLAVCSKNNPDDAMEALERHPGMLLRPNHFASIRVNWADKTQNLREIAADLAVGVDALAFLDDNPVERRLVREALPEVGVIEMPSDPMLYAQVLREHPLFERLVLSAEDRRRAEYYAAGKQARQLENAATTKEDFYRSLGQVAEVRFAKPETVARIAQLTQKTNQFNLTTRRYTEQQIAALSEQPDWRVFSLRVTDCYTDNGIVGVAILHLHQDVCEIDTFLLSCRVIGRTVETAFLAAILDWARTQGVRTIRGMFMGTAKNAPANTFYPTHGFELVEETSGGARWARTIERDPIVCPEWIELRTFYEQPFRTN
jgi:FkbH-like protein